VPSRQPSCGVGVPGKHFQAEQLHQPADLQAAQSSSKVAQADEKPDLVAFLPCYGAIFKPHQQGVVSDHQVYGFSSQENI
jgi:hypothetical protein